MTLRIQVLQRALMAGAIVLTGCVAERYRPADTTAMDADNPCQHLAEIHHVTPFYPDEAVAEGAEGWVKVKYHVAANGEVFNVRVVASSPEGVFDQASAEAMNSWRYPAPGRPLQNCSHVDVYRFEGGANALARRPVVLSPRDQAEFAEFTEETPAPASQR